MAQRNIRATCAGIRETGATTATVQARVTELCGEPACEGAALRNLTCAAWTEAMASAGGSMTVLEAAAAATAYAARRAAAAAADAARRAAAAMAAAAPGGNGTRGEADAAEGAAAAAAADEDAARAKADAAAKDVTDSMGLPLVTPIPEVQVQAPATCGLVGAALPFELVVPGMPFGVLKSFCDTLGSGLASLKKKRACVGILGLNIKCSDSVGEIAGPNSVLDSRCPSTPEKRLDLRPAHAGCCNARRLLLDGRFDETRAAALEACTAIAPALNATIDILKEQVQIQGAMAAVQVAAARGRALAAHSCFFSFFD